MYSRRGVFVFGLSIISAGCMDAGPPSSRDTTTGSTSGSEGNPPPWIRKDSAMDIGVENRLEHELKFTIEIEGSELVGQVNSGATWVSEDIIDSGTTPAIVLRIENGPREEVTWKAEDENERYLLFEVTQEGIDYRMSKKGAINRTQVTESLAE